VVLVGRSVGGAALRSAETGDDEAFGGPPI